MGRLVVVLPVQISVYILPEALLKGTRAGQSLAASVSCNQRWTGQCAAVIPQFAFELGANVMSCVLKAVAAGKSREGRKTLPFLRDAAMQCRMQPACLGSAEHREGVRGSRSTAQEIQYLKNNNN